MDDVPESLRRAWTAAPGSPYDACSMGAPTVKPLPSTNGRASGRLGFASMLLAAYVALLIYGSLFPLGGWEAARGGIRVLLGSFSLRHLSRSDVVTNLVVYVPLGLLLIRAWRTRIADAAKIALATAAGVALSFTFEYAQSYLPTRVSSLVDVTLNGIGTLAGALLAQALTAHSLTGHKLRHLRNYLFLPGRAVNLGLMVLALWIVAQLMPLVPSLDRGTLVQGIRPLLQWLAGAQFHYAQAADYALDIATAGVILAALLRPGHRFLPLFAVGIGVVLLLKIPVVGRQLSPEALSGAALALPLLAWLMCLTMNQRLWTGGIMVMAAFALAQLQPSPLPHAPLLAMNWIPFRGQLEGRAGLEDIAETLWPFAALAYLVLLGRPHRPGLAAAAGSLGVFVFAFLLECLQMRIPGRYPDVTDAFLAAAGWWLPCFYAGRVHDEKDAPAPVAGRRPAVIAAWTIVALLMAAALLAGINKVLNAGSEALDEDRLPRLPAAAEFSPVHFTAFHDAHPRLPAPDDADLARLRRENPNYLRNTASKAQRGDLEAMILSAYADRGTHDLAPLLRRLMALRFTDRGHEQTKPLAVAYDWLYGRWSEPQRAQLRDKLAEGCNYEIEFIRQARLSPYNVYLYNSPFQALMACAIALYHDDPRGDPVMAFTADYWKNRILPVWRQVMGRHGGWHEGGEYLGIGIGTAIYALPAMWRKATGEDLFKSEPGIRGFLDFVIYRTRPDGSDFRWGDGGYYHRVIPDLLPLAMEYDDRAAYSLRPPPPRPVPGSWPWSPLSDDRYYDADAIKALPLTAYFDGIGQIVARSDWGRDATYISFKAGDNYWSHTHLDQGAFTLYKGGALAIDSGFYGPGYQSDHHMNYQYQTIAHNTLTVTDPDDDLPAPARRNQPPRPIANDGGQRRVGSGWGVEAAPLDIDEWERKRDIYHTGNIERLLIKDGLTVAVADITPAYTNARSGTGRFSDRTRRVEDFHRIFGYDRDDDVVVVFDHVVSTKAGFTKRWLLHTLEKPALTPDGFSVETAATDEIGHAGGRLIGKVLLPRKTAIDLVGGSGREFFVNGKNYDAGVAAALQRHRDAEPGQWRIEISPAQAHKADDFLVVMLPSLLTQAPETREVRPLPARAGKPGVEIRGPHHISRWWFDPSGRNVRVEIEDKAGRRSYEPPGEPPSRPAGSSLQRVGALLPH